MRCARGVVVRGVGGQPAARALSVADELAVLVRRGPDVPEVRVCAEVSRAWADGPTSVCACARQNL